MSTDNIDRLMAAQREFYDLRAPDYLVQSRPCDRPVWGGLSEDDVRAMIDELSPAGDVLELACGTGVFTRHLARYATTVTAIDASPNMIERNRNEIAAANVRYVEADILKWSPDQAYDVVFFGNWLSHVPDEKFDDFWALVKRCLTPDGRVAFADEDDRATAFDDTRLVDGIPAARRTLADGRQFDIVKVFRDPATLEATLRGMGWDIVVRRSGDSGMFGCGRPAS